MSKPRLNTSTLHFARSLFLLLMPTSCFAESSSNKLLLEFYTETPITGDLSVNDDTWVGAEVKYFFQHSKPYSFYFSTGYRTDTENTGSSVDIVNFDMGVQHDLTTLWNNRVYAEYSLGIAYINEEFSIALIDREVSNSFNDLGYKASLGIGLDVSKHFSTKFIINKFNDNISAGLSISYSF